MEDAIIQEFVVSAEAFRNGVRFEKPFDECNIQPRASQNALVRYESEYTPVLEDIRFGLQRMHDEEIHNQAFVEAWLEPFCIIAHDWLHQLLDMDNPGEIDQQLTLARMDFFSNERELLSGIFYLLNRRRGMKKDAPVDFTHELANIECYMKNKDLLLAQWALPDFLMACYLRRFPSPESLEYASKEELEVLRSFLHKLAEKGNPEALWRLAEAYDKGNALFDANGELALKYYRLTCNAADQPFLLTQYANALRRLGGDPATAVGLYVNAAACHHAEAMYNLADMFAKGEGIAKSKRAASRLLADVVREETMKYLGKTWNNRLPEAALRLSAFFPVGSHDAYRLVLLAKSALAQRRKIHNWKQDAPLMQQINEAIASQESFHSKAFKETIDPILSFSDLFKDKIKYSATFTPTKDGGILGIKVHDNMENGVRLTTSIAYLPSFSFCGQVVSVAFHCRGSVSCSARQDASYIFDKIVRSGKNEYLFLNEGRKMLQLHCGSFVLYFNEVGFEDYTVQHSFATAIHPDNAKICHWLADGMDVSPGDEVLVLLMNQILYMRVAQTFSCSEKEMPYPLSVYGKVLRVRKARHNECGNTKPTD